MGANITIRYRVRRDDSTYTPLTPAPDGYDGPEESNYTVYGILSGVRRKPCGPKGLFGGTGWPSDVPDDEFAYLLGHASLTALLDVPWVAVCGYDPTFAEWLRKLATQLDPDRVQVLWSFDQS